MRKKCLKVKCVTFVYVSSLTDFLYWTSISLNQLIFYTHLSIIKKLPGTLGRAVTLEALCWNSCHYVFDNFNTIVYLYCLISLLCAVLLIIPKCYVPDTCQYLTLFSLIFNWTFSHYFEIIKIFKYEVGILVLYQQYWSTNNSSYAK